MFPTVNSGICHFYLIYLHFKGKCVVSLLLNVPFEGGEYTCGFMIDKKAYIEIECVDMGQFSP